MVTVHSLHGAFLPSWHALVVFFPPRSHYHKRRDYADLDCWKRLKPLSTVPRPVFWHFESIVTAVLIHHHMVKFTQPHTNLTMRLSDTTYKSSQLRVYSVSIKSLARCLCMCGPSTNWTHTFNSSQYACASARSTALPSTGSIQLLYPCYSLCAESSVRGLMALGSNLMTIFVICKPKYWDIV
jgi:hypothetical protein